MRLAEQMALWELRSDTPEEVCRLIRDLWTANQELVEAIREVRSDYNQSWHGDMSQVEFETHPIIVRFDALISKYSSEEKNDA